MELTKSLSIEDYEFSKAIKPKLLYILVLINAFFFQSTDSFRRINIKSFLSPPTSTTTTKNMQYHLHPLPKQKSKAGSFITSYCAIDKNIPSYDMDVLGMVNFCLKPTDTTLSEATFSKLLNEYTNIAFKAIMINFEPIVENTIASIAKFKEDIRKTTYGDNNCDLIITQSTSLNSKTEEIEAAYKYACCLEDLLRTGQCHHSMLGWSYDRGYKQLLTILKDAGCVFPNNNDVNDQQLQRPQPKELAICLSMADAYLAPSTSSPTKLLNKYSNLVVRSMLYGDSYEKQIISFFLEQESKKFKNNDQQLNFILALSLLLTTNLAIAQAAITGNISHLESVLRCSAAQAKNNNLSTSFPVKNEIKPLRLYEVYSNAFQRVVAECAKQVGDHSLIVPKDVEMLQNLIVWEQSLRQNLTEEIWNKNPAELVGTWELIDIMADTPTMISSSDTLFEGSEKTMVDFLPDGKVEIKLNTACDGQMWGFHPGPAHLDTCEFEVKSKSNPNLVLRYMGFIDRGQRIEGRFSKLPIKMSGRIMSIIGNEVVGTSRFLMMLNREKKQKKKITLPGAA